MDMVEKVARVLEPQAWAALGIGDTLAYKNRRTSSLRKARAAIEAMCEPTEAMLRSVEGYCVGCCNMSKSDVSGVWDLLIDAALNTKGGE